MKASKILIALLLFTLLISQASAQSFNTNSPVEESLVNFVNQVLGFPASSASDVILYFLAPIAGLYFLLSNFMAYGFENFEERLGRKDYISSEEDELPRGLKLLSLIISFITVTTVGAASGGMALIGLIALALIIAILLGLMGGGDGGNGGNNENGGGGGNNNNNGGGQNQGGNNQQESEHSWWDVLERGSELGADAASAAKNYTEKQRKKQIEESLKYFESDFIAEFEKFEKNLNKFNQYVSDAEKEVGNKLGGDKESNSFKHILQRSLIIRNKSDDYEEEFRNDNSNNHQKFNSGSKLRDTIETDMSNNEDISRQLKKVSKQLDRLLDDSSTVPKDEFDKILANSEYILAVAHFVHEHPDYSNLNSDRKLAEETVKIATSMGINPNLTGKRIRRLMSMSKQSLKSETKSLVKDIERISKNELEIDESRLKTTSKLIDEDKQAHNNIKAILVALDNYYNYPKGDKQFWKNYFKNCENIIENEIKNKLERLERSLDKNKEYESEIFEKISELESKI